MSVARELEAFARERGGIYEGGSIAASLFAGTLGLVRLAQGEALVTLTSARRMDKRTEATAHACFVDGFGPPFSLVPATLLSRIATRLGAHRRVLGTDARFDDAFLTQTDEVEAARLVLSADVRERMLFLRARRPRLVCTATTIALSWLDNGERHLYRVAVDLVVAVAHTGADIRDRLRHLPAARALRTQSYRGGEAVVEIDTPHGPVRMQRHAPFVAETVVAYAMLRSAIPAFVARVGPDGHVQGDVPGSALASVADTLGAVGVAKLEVTEHMAMVVLPAHASDERLLTACRVAAALAGAPRTHAFR